MEIPTGCTLVGIVLILNRYIRLSSVSSCHTRVCSHSISMLAMAMLIMPVVWPHVMPLLAVHTLIVKTSKVCNICCNVVMEASVVHLGTMALWEDDTSINEVLLLLLREVLVSWHMPAALAITMRDEHVQVIAQLVVRALALTVACARVDATAVVVTILFLTVVHDSDGEVVVHLMVQVCTLDVGAAALVAVAVRVLCEHTCCATMLGLVTHVPSPCAPAAATALVTHSPGAPVCRHTVYSTLMLIALLLLVQMVAHAPMILV